MGQYRPFTSEELRALQWLRLARSAPAAYHGSVDAMARWAGVSRATAYRWRAAFLALDTTRRLDGEYP